MAGINTTKPDIMVLQSKTYSKQSPVAIMGCFALNESNDADKTINFVSNAHKSAYKSDQTLKCIGGDEVPYKVFNNPTVAPNRIEYEDKFYWLDRVENNYNGDTAYKVYCYENIVDHDGYLKVIYSSSNGSYTVQYQPYGVS